MPSADCKITHHITKYGRFSSSCITSSKGASYSSMRTTTWRPVCSQARMMSVFILSLRVTALSGFRIFLMLKELHIQHAFQCFLVHMLGQTHIKVQYRIFRPFGFQLFDGKPFEKVFLPGKITMQRRNQQRFTEPAGDGSGNNIWKHRSPSGKYIPSYLYKGSSLLMTSSKVCIPIGHLFNCCCSMIHSFFDCTTKEQNLTGNF